MSLAYLFYDYNFALINELNYKVEGFVIFKQPLTNSTKNALLAALSVSSFQSMLGSSGLTCSKIIYSEL